MRVGLTEMLEPEAKTDNSGIWRRAQSEKTLRHRGGTALQNDMKRCGLLRKWVRGQKTENPRSPF